MLKGIVNGVEKDIVKVPMFDNGVEHDGWEVRDNQDRLIWGREDEFEGTDSIPIKGYGTPLTSVTIKGNGVQSGTPSPQNIVSFDGTGDRTAQLFDISSVIYGTWTNGSGVANPYSYAARSIDIQSSQITVSFNGSAFPYSYSIVWVDSDGEFIIRNHIGSATQIKEPQTFTPPSNAAKFYVQISNGTDTANPITEAQIESYKLMLNLGSTALQYEPYGYKIPITCAGQTMPVYLGQTPTVRRIKKLVLTGEENWRLVGRIASVGGQYFNLSIVTQERTEFGKMLCSHYTAANPYDRLTACCVLANYSQGIDVRVNNPSTDGNIADFKSYLAAQYAAGTPVTVWYVLAEPEPETAIVNEPLMKIGDYADTLTTDTPIPTTTGATDVTVDTKIPPSELTIKVHAKKIRYGFKIDKSQENSESTVIYTHDAVTMTPAVMDFTNDRFSYGSWENAWFVRDARPCALKLDGTVAYYLDPNDATKKLDGTASDIYYELLTEEPSDWSTQWKQYYTKSGDDYTLNDQAEAPTFATNTYYKLTYNSSFTGNFMVEFPQVWFYRHEDSQYNYIEISNHRLSDDWKCYAHINTNGQQVDFIYLPLFKGVIKDSKLRSLPGQIPQGNTSATTEVNAATALGSRWQIWDHSSVEMINDLLVLMTKSIDSQGRFGQGRSGGYDSTDTVTYGKLQTGTLIKKGKFHGYSTTTKEVKVFGIEGFWANRWDRLQGMLLVNNVWKIKMTPPYNFTGTDFVTLSNAEVPSGNGYLSKVKTSEYGSIPASIANGSSTKYFKDYFYKTTTDTRVAIRGGYCHSGSNAGFRCVYVNNAASYSNWHFGASPVYK